MASTFHVHLYRDSLTTPWGFRVQGGKDFDVPLTVQKISVGSPAETDLRRGDIIVKVDSHDVEKLTHKECLDILKKTGGNVYLIIKRTGVKPGGGKLEGRHHKVIKGSDRVDLNPQELVPMGWKIPSDAYLGALCRPLGRSLTPPPSPSSAQVYRTSPLDLPSAKPFASSSGAGMFGTDYSQYRGPGARAQDDQMAHRIQHSLGQAVASHPADLGIDYRDYGSRTTPRRSQSQRGPRGYGQKQQHPVYQPSQSFNAPSTPTYSPSTPTYQPTTPTYQSAPPKSPLKHTIWKPPPPNPVSKPPEFGWTPSWRNPAKTSNVQSPRPAQGVVEEPQTPAWSGTLRNTSNTRAYDSELAYQQPPQQNQYQQPPQHAHHSPKQVSFQQDLPDSGYVPVHQPHVQDVSRPGQAGPGGENARVVHLQYNSPLGLYSKENVNETLTGQTGGKPGQGTMQVTSGPSWGGRKAKPFSPTTSPTFALIAEEEGRRQKPAGYGLPENQPQYMQPQQQQLSPGAHYTGQHHSAGYQPSPALQHLEHNLAAQAEYGASDF